MARLVIVIEDVGDDLIHVEVGGKETIVEEEEETAAEIMFYLMLELLHQDTDEVKVTTEKLH